MRGLERLTKGTYILRVSGECCQIVNEITRGIVPETFTQKLCYGCPEVRLTVRRENRVASAALDTLKRILIGNQRAKVETRSVFRITYVQFYNENLILDTIRP